MQQDIYSREFLHYYKNQQHKKDIKKATHRGRGVNYSCGDEVELSLVVDDGTIKDVGYKIDACIVSQSALSILAENIVGMKIEEARNLSMEDFIDMLNIDLTPSRQKCALTGYRALMEAVSLSSKSSNKNEK